MADGEGRSDSRGRTGSQWAADVAAVAVAAGGGALLLVVGPGVSPTRLPDPSQAGFAIDGAIGAAMCVATWFRRRWPVAVALITLVPEAVSLSSGAAALLSVLTVAMYRRTGVALTVAALHQAVIFAYYPLWAPYPFWAVWLWSATEVTGLVAVGMYVRARRELIASLRERVERAQAEQNLLADQARLAERTRIAREMHDVLAHRVSLIALHAGALEVRPDLPPPDVREAAELIRSTARQALEELRGVVGVLRQPDGGAEEAPRAPQPTLADVPRLVEESRQAGMKVDLRMRVEDAHDASGALGRDTYRIVREALTNVSKHARGTATTVSLTGGPGDGLRVVVRNRLPARQAAEPALPGAGVGLVGLVERVALAGGTLQHGPSPEGDFVVDATLRWNLVTDPATDPAAAG